MAHLDETIKKYDNVEIGENAVIYPPVILGQPPRGCAAGERKLVIGRNAVIRAFTTIYAGTTIGDGFQCGQGVSIREDNVIGNDVSVGTNTVIEHHNTIGDYTRIHSSCFLEMVTLGRRVFVAPNVVFTDDFFPLGCPQWEKCGGGATVEDHAVIGGNSTLLPRVLIGRGALIGAGSVVTRDVPPMVVVAGNPARIIKKVSELTCPSGLCDGPYAGKSYE
jgi:acetyltransferase-like isoleucine patch superfamily enzyme